MFSTLLLDMDRSNSLSYSKNKRDNCQSVCCLCVSACRLSCTGWPGYAKTQTVDCSLEQSTQRRVNETDLRIFFLLKSTTPNQQRVIKINMSFFLLAVFHHHQYLVTWRKSNSGDGQQANTSLPRIIGVYTPWCTIVTNLFHKYRPSLI